MIIFFSARTPYGFVSYAKTKNYFYLKQQIYYAGDFSPQ